MSGNNGGKERGGGGRREEQCESVVVLTGAAEEVVEKDLLIQEKEKLYVELKNILARQPGPEVAEQLSIYQQNLREKTRQMKVKGEETESGRETEEGWETEMHSWCVCVCGGGWDGVEEERISC